MNKLYLYVLFLFVLVSFTRAQEPDSLNPTNNYWNNNTPLVSYRLPPPPIGYEPSYIDLDGDGDADIIKSITVHNKPIMWIDDDDDMQDGDLEGDTDSDCLLIDVNNDGKYCDRGDIAVDWVDTDGDGNADMQVFIENSKENPPKRQGRGHYMWVIDTDKDNVFNYIDWNTFELRAWLHEGRSNFLEDYNGKSTFLKTHNSTDFMGDLRFNWENPFLFFDPDNDGLTEMAMRVLDRPSNREGTPNRRGGPEGTPYYVAISYNMDNDNAPGNELDYDMSFRFEGKGFDYLNQVHKFNNVRVEAADSFFMDPRWRQLTELIYPDHNSALSLTYNKSDWENICFVYDEDDDCERWERVEFYDPLNPFKIGGRNPFETEGQDEGGLDYNLQADAIGDRGEWDMDNSGNANLYISNFDGRLHLYGAEWGCWRIDQLAYSYQGWGGLYDTYTPNWERLQKEFSPFSTFKYEDTDNNGFIDKIQMDIDGDTIFEKTVSFKDIGIDDKCDIINTSVMDYEDFRKLHTSMSDSIWKQAENALKIADKVGLNTSWYAFMKSPKSEHQRYSYGYWLQFYVYMDLIDSAKRANDKAKIEKIDKAYFGGDWDSLLD